MYKQNNNKKNYYYYSDEFCKRSQQSNIIKKKLNRKLACNGFYFQLAMVVLCCVDGQRFYVIISTFNFISIYLCYLLYYVKENFILLSPSHRHFLLFLVFTKRHSSGFFFSYYLTYCNKYVFSYIIIIHIPSGDYSTDTHKAFLFYLRSQNLSNNREMNYYKY